MSAKMEFKGFDEAMSMLRKLNGDVKQATEKALEETQKLVADNAEQAIRKHHRTGTTEASITRDGKTEWEGSVGSIGAGFKISKGGLPSIFLMYGTARGVQKDQKLYNSVYGNATQRKVHQIQEDMLEEAIRKAR